MKRITPETLSKYELHLRFTEKSKGTIEKYMRDITRFSEFAKGKDLTKDTVIEYKNKLMGECAPVTVNSMLSALNGFFDFIKRPELKVKPIKTQRKIFADEDRCLIKYEYLKLLKTAKNLGYDRLFMIMETLGATGIRISELAFITAEAVKIGQAEVNCKGKIRTVFLNKKLRAALLSYIKKNKIKSGSIFITKTGKPIARENVWREMKRLARKTNINPRKVFPHNLRHLFTTEFYKLDKDLAKLADLLGHANIETIRIYIMETGKNHEILLSKMEILLW